MVSFVRLDRSCQVGAELFERSGHDGISLVLIARYTLCSVLFYIKVVGLLYSVRVLVSCGVCLLMKDSYGRTA